MPWCLSPLQGVAVPIRALGEDGVDLLLPFLVLGDHHLQPRAVLQHDDQQVAVQPHLGHLRQGDGEVLAGVVELVGVKLQPLPREEHPPADALPGGAALADDGAVGGDLGANFSEFLLGTAGEQGHDPPEQKPRAEAADSPRHKAVLDDEEHPHGGAEADGEDQELPPAVAIDHCIPPVGLLSVSFIIAYFRGKYNPYLYRRNFCAVPFAEWEKT